MWLLELAWFSLQRYFVGYCKEFIIIWLFLNKKKTAELKNLHIREGFLLAHIGGRYERDRE